MLPSLDSILMNITKRINIYRIRPNYRPCPHYPPPDFFTLFSLIIADLTIFFLTVYLIFTYYRPLDDLLALVKDNKFTEAPRALIRSNTVDLYILTQKYFCKLPLEHTIYIYETNGH